MTWEICRKELLKNFQSFRFFALFAVTVFLFAVNPFLLSTEYDEKLQEYNRNMEQFKTRGKTHGIAAHKRPNPLSFVFEGGDQDAATSFRIALDSGIMPHSLDQYGVNLTFPKFQTIDWVFILKVLFSLFAILLTFDAISGEKERGTLSLICSNSIPRASIIMGKYLGALITIIIPAAVGMLVGLIIVSIMGNTSLTMEVISRLALVAVMALAYISLFVLIGIVISSIAYRSSVSLLLSLSVWIILVIVVPNLAGIIAESVSDVLPEHEFNKRHRAAFAEAFEEWREIAPKKRFKTAEEASEELGRMLNEQGDKRMRVMDSYRNSIYANEDLALNISKISPASAFEFAAAEIVDAGVTSQRRFSRAARRYYDMYEDYVLEKTGTVRKYIFFPPMFSVEIEGKTVKIGTPSRISLPDDTSDFPNLPRYNLSVSESIASGLWNIVLLAVWNIALFLLSHLFFLKYDVR